MKCSNVHIRYITTPHLFKRHYTCFKRATVIHTKTPEPFFSRLQSIAHIDPHSSHQYLSLQNGRSCQPKHVERSRYRSASFSPFSIYGLLINNGRQGDGA